MDSQGLASTGEQGDNSGKKKKKCLAPEVTTLILRYKTSLLM